jgi:ketosteroid isomerase-like protein
MMEIETTLAPDVRMLLSLNRDYIEAVQRSNADWFRGVLADDFRCSLPDGSIIDRERFLERAAQPLDVSNLEVHDVEVRVMGDAAIVHARTSFSTADGRPGSGRYTDVWWRLNGRWRAAAAHFTRRLE